MIPQISLILPAYNEARVIAVTIGEAVRYFESRGLSYQIIVAADGADGTREIVGQMAKTNPALHVTGAATVPARRECGLPLVYAVGGRPRWDPGHAMRVQVFPARGGQGTVPAAEDRRLHVRRGDSGHRAAAGLSDRAVADPLARRRRQPARSGERQPAQRARHFPDRAGTPVRREIRVRAFVTGAAGFIGSNLVDRLLAAGHEVTGFDNLSTGFRRFLEGAEANARFRLVEDDLLDLEAVKRAMAGADFVFHLAANADVRYGPLHPRRDLEQNTIVTWNVLEAMRTAGARRIAFSSTGSVYGEPEIFPTPETAPFPAWGRSPARR